ncbi:MAG: glycosyltransferase family 2 protein [Candidatus Omnitrophica bacterium]|nr:glycosyltransferase family 2 protein [Candidatus Omnitrophota bacterium]
MISVIIPAFNEQENLDELYQRLSDVALKVKGHDFEFIFVDDCSADDTQKMLKILNEKDKRVKAIRFARNSGSHAALAAGLNSCCGDCAIALAADLQDPPELISSLVEKWEKGAKTVWAARSRRDGESFSVRIFSRIYYALINALTNIQVSALGADVFLIDRKVIEALRKMPEKHSSIYMAIAWLGFTQETICYVKEARHKGKSKWNLRMKVKLLLDSILSFSDIFIRLISIFGFLMAFSGFVYALSIICRYFFFGIPGQGWSSLIVAIFVLGGIQMIMLGILGEYVWRTFDESRNRPQYVVDYTIGLG